MRDAVSEWQALSALYEQAETLTAPALDLWLARLANEGHPLVEPLTQMLGARAKVRRNGFLSALPALPVGLSSSDLEPGARIGPYRLLRAIGSGGMAEVWQAERDDGAFRRTVAIKLLFRHVGGAQGESFAQRFTRERDILASLDHPNIARLHDAGVTPAGQPWLALEYVEGETLTAWCDRARLGVRARVDLFRQVLLAVQHAHANLVIHRDLKPANILVTQAGEVRLLDFGIAKLMEAEGGVLADTELTRHAGRLMTVAYASPEQLTGRPLTTATDVYSLGVVFYELLCGERPAEPKRDSPALLEQAILDIDPRPPSRRALSEAVAAARGSTPDALRKSLGNDLDAITLRALAKQPAQRYPSVEALRVELDRWLAGEPVEARAPSQAYRIAKFAQRHRLGVALGSGAVTALLVVAAVAVWLGLQARQESARALAARDFMMGMFKQADTDKSHGADVTARELLDRGRDDVLRRLKGQPALQADLLEGIAGIQSSMGELTKADVTFGELVRLHRRLGDPMATARALAAQADNALSMGQLDRADALVAEVGALPRRVTTQPDIAVSVGLTRGWLSLWGGDPGRAKAVFQDALARADDALGPVARPALSALVGVVQSNAALREFDAALAAQKELASRQLRAPGKTPRDVIGLDVGHAELLFAAGRVHDAASLEHEATPRCVAALGVNEALCRRLAYRGVFSNLRLGSTNSIRAGLPVVSALATDTSSPDFRIGALLTQFRALSQLGELQSHPEVAADVKALAGAQRMVDGSHRVMAMQALAEDALRNADAAAALRWSNEALEVCRTACAKVPGFAVTPTTQLLKGMALLAQGRTEDALALLRIAQEGENRELGTLHPQALLYSINQAVALEALARPAEALAVLDVAQPVLADALGDDTATYRRIEALRARLLAEVSRPSLRRSNLTVAASPSRVDLYN